MAIDQGYFLARMEDVALKLGRITHFEDYIDMVEKTTRTARKFFMETPEVFLKIQETKFTYTEYLYVKLPYKNAPTPRLYKVEVIDCDEFNKYRQNWKNYYLIEVFLY